MGRLFQSKGQVIDFRGSWNLFKWWFGISWGCALVGSGAIVLVEAPAIAAVGMLIGAWLLWFVGLRIPAGAGMWKDRGKSHKRVCQEAHAQAWLDFLAPHGATANEAIETLGGFTAARTLFHDSLAP